MYPPVVAPWLHFRYLEVPIFETILLFSFTDRIANLSSRDCISTCSSSMAAISLSRGANIRNDVTLFVY